MASFTAIENILILNDYTTIDIAELIEEVVLYESIESTGCSGHIIITDTLNLQETLPILGNERIYIKWVSDQVSTFKEMLLDVNAIVNLSNTSNTSKRFKIELLSTEDALNSNIKINKSYTGKVSDIASQIAVEYLGITEEFFDAEATDEVKTVVIPSLTPIQAIKYLSRLAYSIEYSDHQYLFFQTTRNKYRFCSMEFLKDGEKLYEINDNLLSEPASIRDLSKIKNWNLGESFNLLMNNEKGVFANKIITHNIINKTITTTEKYWTDKGEGIIILERENVSADAKVTISSDNYIYSDAHDKHSASIQNNKNYKMMVEVNGNNKLCAGDIIHAAFKTTNEASLNQPDVVLSNKYLISKIKHVISEQDYTMVMQLNDNI